MVIISYQTGSANTARWLTKPHLPTKVRQPLKRTHIPFAGVRLTTRKFTHAVYECSTTERGAKRRLELLRLNYERSEDKGTGVQTGADQTDQGWAVER